MRKKKDESNALVNRRNLQLCCSTDGPNPGQASNFYGLLTAKVLIEADLHFTSSEVEAACVLSREGFAPQDFCKFTSRSVPWLREACTGPAIGLDSHVASTCLLDRS